LIFNIILNAISIYLFDVLLFCLSDIRTEEAFKIADLDFDGNIGKKDLLLFLRDILHIPAEAITPTRLDRLFKLIDQHKRD